MKLIKQIFGVGIGLTLSFGLATSSQAQVTQQGGGYLLRMKYAPGMILKYEMSTAMTGAPQGQGMNFVIPMVMKVTKVSNGVASIDATVGPMKGQKGQAQKMSMTMDSRGKTTGQQNSPVQTQLPEKPVKIGEKWSNSANVNGMNVKATYTFRGLKNVGGKSVAAIDVAFSGSMGAQGTMSGTGTQFLMVNDGSLYTMNMKMNMAMTNPQNKQKMNIGTTISMVRK